MNKYASHFYAGCVGFVLAAIIVLFAVHPAKAGERLTGWYCFTGKDLKVFYSDKEWYVNTFLNTYEAYKLDENGNMNKIPYVTLSGSECHLYR